DLSANMIELARARGGYDELCVGELCGFMRTRPKQFDAVISADTLVYFGALEEFSAVTAAALRTGGLLVFTTEAPAHGTEPFQVHGRYAHAEHYLRGVLTSAGFAILELEREVLRMERMQEVAGYLVVARNAGS